MATYGKVEEHKEDEEWVEYIERLTHYFTANEIENGDKQRSILLSVIIIFNNVIIIIISLFGIWYLQKSQTRNLLTSWLSW